MMLNGHAMAAALLASAAASLVSSRGTAAARSTAVKARNVVPVYSTGAM
jgi:hypothetical protein